MSSTEVFKTLNQVQETLSPFRPRKRWFRRWVKRSAVAMLVRDGKAGPEVLMIKRAEREGDRWSGHMAFPGGRMETDDQHSKATAERETREEIGVDPAKVGHCIGRLSDIMTQPHSGLRPMVITPYVYALKRFPEPRPNYEVDEVIWVPLNFLADEGNREKMIWEKGRLKIELSCYWYQERRIWGLSLAMLDELVSLFQ
ncbi:8-oxo-dGTP pyrophosphatase MutT (NUDIX family) [Litorivivens lipolytica]|uniref:8-oxo-dGTP pyrophosphatase MutT (NUDIX family) n=1 Tax=Litorivivens lipolytica TaxID=1524264 RepID=A0A7W4W799_9GAMM|nr:CoA pyrophosphatase [Litorivivens lipolytica]MBB3048162.1 8-oxo-dGTP pyrophosphatase MutT (NUDIX family) [Litorivivens lipolytica]